MKEKPAYEMNIILPMFGDLQPRLVIDRVTPPRVSERTRVLEATAKRLVSMRDELRRLRKENKELKARKP